MYDITQLNDLLVPELQDIAEQFDISNAKKLVKQDLINKILENQSIMSTDKKKDGEKPKRKRIVKSADAETTKTKNLNTSACLLTKKLNIFFIEILSKLLNLRL